MATAFFLLALMGLSEPCVEAGRTASRLLPVDEARSKPEFFAYRARLRAAVERRDVDATVIELHPGVRLGFDGSGGIDRFRKLVVERPEAWEN